LFLFPAEDCILDRIVTGVQTCALPILFGLGKEIMKTEKKPTKNVVISERDYKNLVTAARDNDRLKQHVRNLMSTDMAREYKKLSKEHGQVKEKYSGLV